MADDLSAHLLQQALDLQAQGQRVEAERAYRALIARGGPDAVPALNNLGNLLKARRQLGQAQICFELALRAQPDHPDIHNNLGVLLHEAGQMTEAEASFGAALRAAPDHPQALNNLANLLKDLGRFQEAQARYQGLLEKHPDHPDGRWNLALLWLLQGRYEQAWPLYESRFNPARGEPESLYPALPSPRWQGEPLKGKTLLIWSEQGMGDEIQMCRFASVVRKRHGPSRILLGCKAPLKPLLATVPGIDEITTIDAPAPPHDFWCFPGSLPYFCGTTLDNLPNRLPYLGALPERTAHWLPQLQSLCGDDDGMLRVGLVWAGNRLHKNDYHRSLPSLRVLAPLWDVEGIVFVSLQHGADDDPAVREASHPPAAQPLIHLGQSLKDFGDTAAILMGLDLVICADTAIAHVAGALARPCWVMLPHRNLDWRWLLQRSDSPWYPDVIRLFRQGPEADWQPVVAGLARSLWQWRAQKLRTRHLLAGLALDDLSILKDFAQSVDSTQIGATPDAQR